MQFENRPYQPIAIEKAREVMASGVRRFIFQAPTGSGKCVDGDTFVWSSGLRTFGELMASNATEIRAPESLREVNGWYDDGINDGFVVTLRCGLKINGTIRHPIWIRTEDGFEGWRELGQLTGSEYVAVARGSADWGDKKIAPEEAYALGLFVADGSIAETHLNIDKQAPVLRRIMPVLEKWRSLTGNPSTRPITIHNRSDYHDAVSVFGRNFDKVLWDLYGYKHEYSEYRSVPTGVLQGNKETVRNFLSGLFDGDGYADKYVAIATSSKKLGDQIHGLLTGLGILVNRRTKKTPHLDAHVLEVNDLSRFDHEIGITRYGLKKDRNYELLLSKPRNTNIDTIPGIGQLLRGLAKRVESKQRHETWRLVDAYYSGDKKPSYRMLALWLKSAPECEEKSILQRIHDQHFAWSKIESIEANRSRRIDCEVANEHAFVGNGIVNHNTILSGMLVQRILEKDKRIVFAAHRHELVIQPKDKFIDMGIPESDIGVIKSGEEKLRNRNGRIQIVSIQSVYKKQMPPADVVFIDECHLVRAAMYEWLLAQYPNAYIIGLSATPTRLDGKPLGDVFDDIVVVAQPSELFAGGWIVAPRILTVPQDQLPDMEGVGHVGGDFNEKDVHERVTKREVMGSIPEHWINRGGKGLRTMLFAADIKHSKMLVELLTGLGIRTRHVDGKTPKKERKKALDDLRSGEIEILSQVGLWIEGLDMPELKCAIMARPTESLVIHLQTAGRIMRPWNGVTPILLDHAGNCERYVSYLGKRLGLPTQDRVYELHPPKRKKGDVPREKPEFHKCKQCLEYFPIDVTICPVCGIPFSRNREIVYNTDVELVEITEETQPRERNDSERVKRDVFQRLWMNAYKDGRDEGWVLRRFAERFGDAPPEGWQPPPKPEIKYTVAQKRKELARLHIAAHKNNKPNDWVEERYQAKFGEPLSSLAEQEKAEAIATAEVKAENKPPAEIVDLEF